MTTKATSHPPPSDQRSAPSHAKLARLPDPPRDPDAMQQISVIAVMLYILKEFFSGREDILVGSEGYLCQNPGTRSRLYVPDIVFAKEVAPGIIVNIQNGYVIDDVGKPPNLVIEVASPSTGRLDYTTKRDGYARLGVGEYWRFDPSGGEYHDRPLAGDLLVDGKYEPIEIHYQPDGVAWGRSEALGLDLYWEEGNPRFYDYERGVFLPDYGEAIRQRDLEMSRRMLAEAEVERLNERLRQLDK